MKHEMFQDMASILREARHTSESSNGPTASDPEWPLHYAEYMSEAVAKKLKLSMSKSELVYCLMKADIEHQAREPDTDWAEFYADCLFDHCAPFEDTPQDTLILYHFIGCPFCAMVTSAIKRMNLDIELRDIMQNGEYRQELMAARGRGTVPVLRITSPDHDEVWMPESRDIVHYLEEHYG